jgi:hypothetical protein
MNAVPECIRRPNEDPKRRPNITDQRGKIATGRAKETKMPQQIPATLESINEDTGVWHFIEQGGTPRSGKYVKGPQPAVGTSGGIASVGNNSKNFVFVWASPQGVVPYQTIFSPV